MRVVHMRYPAVSGGRTSKDYIADLRKRFPPSLCNAEISGSVPGAENTLQT